MFLLAFTVSVVISVYLVSINFASKVSLKKREFEIYGGVIFIA